MWTAAIVTTVITVGVCSLTVRGDTCDSQYLLPTTSASPSTVLSVAAINAILVAHNNARRQVNPVASQMPMLTWNQTLADFAQGYMSQCLGMVHSTSAMRSNASRFGWSYIGENLAAGSGGNMVPPAGGAAATTMWVGEISSWTYGQVCASGQVCGHYTQVIWAGTLQVGCGYASCPSQPYVNYWSCNYGPGGNIVGQNEYPTGGTADACQTSAVLTTYPITAGGGVATPSPPTLAGGTTTSPAPVTAIFRSTVQLWGIFTFLMLNGQPNNALVTAVMQDISGYVLHISSSRFVVYGFSLSGGVLTFSFDVYQAFSSESTTVAASEVTGFSQLMINANQVSKWPTTNALLNATSIAVTGSPTSMTAVSTTAVSLLNGGAGPSPTPTPGGGLNNNNNNGPSPATSSSTCGVSCIGFSIAAAGGGALIFAVLAVAFMAVFYPSAFQFYFGPKGVIGRLFHSTPATDVAASAKPAVVTAAQQPQQQWNSNAYAQPQQRSGRPY